MHAVGVSAKQPMLLSHAQRQGPFRVRSGHKAIPESGLRRLPGRWARFQGRAGNTFVLGKLNPPPLPFLDLMTYPVKPGHYVRIDLKEPPNQCPLWVKSGHQVNGHCPPSCQRCRRCRREPRPGSAARWYRTPNGHVLLLVSRLARLGCARRRNKVSDLQP